MTLTPEQIAEGQALLAKATPGPWFASDWEEDDGPNRTVVESHSVEVLAAGSSSIWPDGIEKRRIAETNDGEHPIEDAALIAWLRNNADALLSAASELARLTGRVRTIEAETVERCAKVAEAHVVCDWSQTYPAKVVDDYFGKTVAAAIRSLTDNKDTGRD